MARKKSEKAANAELRRKLMDASVDAGLTEAESDLLGITSGLWNEFVALPELHAGHRGEVHFLIHAIQDKVLARPALRAYERHGLLSSGKTEGVEQEGGA